MISILLSKHLQEQVRDEFFRDRTSSGYADNSPTTVLSFPEPRLGPMAEWLLNISWLLLNLQPCVGSELLLAFDTSLAHRLEFYRAPDFVE